MHCSDDATGSKDDEKIPFLDFCPDWEDAILWQTWKDYNNQALRKGQGILHLPYVCTDDPSR